MNYQGLPNSRRRERFTAIHPARALTYAFLATASLPLVVAVVGRWLLGRIAGH